MKKIILFSLFAIAVFPNINFACSCAPPTTFCEGLPNSIDGIIHGVIFRGKIIGEAPLSKEVKINEVIFGNVNQRKVIVNQAICDFFFRDLKNGKEYIFYVSEHDGAFFPNSCTVYFLEIENEIVKGKIAPGIESIPYSELESLEGSCGDAFKNSVSVFPNPTGGDLRIKNLYSENTIENLQMEVFDVLGRKIADFANPEAILPEETWNINIERFAPGVYFFKLSGNHREGFFKIVKQ